MATERKTILSWPNIWFYWCIFIDPILFTVLLWLNFVPDCSDSNHKIRDWNCFLQKLCLLPGAWMGVLNRWLRLYSKIIITLQSALIKSPPDLIMVIHLIWGESESHCWNFPSSKPCRILDSESFSSGLTSFLYKVSKVVAFDQYPLLKIY